MGRPSKAMSLHTNPCPRGCPPSRTERMSSDEPGARRKQALSMARALNALASKTGKRFSMNSRDGRFRIQKTVYLLRHLRYAPAQRFAFNLYHMGPYSPDLAAAYYELEDAGIRGAGAATDLPAPTCDVVREALAGNDDFLEGLTTLLDIWSGSHDLKSAYPHARQIKPHLDERTWKEVRQFLTGHAALITIT
jgi:hypothetical protein